MLALCCHTLGKCLREQCCVLSVLEPQTLMHSLTRLLTRSLTHSLTQSLHQSISQSIKQSIGTSVVHLRVPYILPAGRLVSLLFLLFGIRQPLWQCRLPRRQSFAASGDREQ